MYSESRNKSTSTCCLLDAQRRRKISALVKRVLGQAKPGPMPADDRLRLDDHQGVQDAGCKPIKARKYESIGIAKNKPLWRFSAQHIELMAECHNLRLERGSRSEKPGDHP